MKVRYQMGQTQIVDVSVSISQEMRDLRNSAAALRAPSQLHLEQGVNRFDGRQKRAQSIRLRRDGKRPLQFLGCLLFQASEQWAHHEISFDHTFSLYTDDAHRIIAALTLQPNGDMPMRPAHWVEVTQDQGALQSLANRWCDHVLASAMSSNRTASIQDARSAFHSMTAHSLRVALPQKERKEPCLQ